MFTPHSRPPPAPRPPPQGTPHDPPSPPPASPTSIPPPLAPTHHTCPIQGGLHGEGYEISPNLEELILERHLG